MPRHNTSASTRRRRNGPPLPAGKGDTRPSKLYVVEPPPPPGPALATPVAPAGPAGTDRPPRTRAESLRYWALELNAPADLAVVARRLDPAVSPRTVLVTEAPGLTRDERKNISRVRRTAWVVVLHGGVAPAA